MPLFLERVCHRACPQCQSQSGQLCVEWPSAGGRGKGGSAGPAPASGCPCAPRRQPWGRRVEEYLSEWGTGASWRGGRVGRAAPLLACRSGRLCHRGFTSVCLSPVTVPRLGSESCRGRLYSLGPLWIRTMGKGKGVNKQRLEKELGDSGRASKERMLGGLALTLWVLHQFLFSGGSPSPRSPLWPLEGGVLPEEPGHEIMWG